MILNYIKSLFKKNVVEIEEPKEFKVLPPCLFKIGDIVNIKFLKAPTKKFKICYIFESSNSIVVEYFYDGKLFTFCKDEFYFEQSFETNSSDITYNDFFHLVLVGDLHSIWRRK